MQKIILMKEIMSIIEKARERYRTPRSATPDGLLMFPSRWGYTDGGGCAQNIGIQSEI